MSKEAFVDKEEQIITGINNLYHKIGWLNRLKLAQNVEDHDFKTYSSSEIFCIEYIGDHQDPNVTKLAAACFMTRSALSKLTKKLINKGLIERYQRPANKKEIYFRLTPAGQAVYDLHAEMTRRFLVRDQAVFAALSGEQTQGILDFFAVYNEHLDRELALMDGEE